MKVTVLGSSICPDTQAALKTLKENHVETEFEDVSTDLAMLKKFVKLRESNPLYDAVRARDGLGIPVFFLKDGTVTLDMQEVLKQK